MKVGSLFAGIGGLELGLERAGMEATVFQAEYDKQARRVLARHWPDVHRYEDVHDVRFDQRGGAASAHLHDGRGDADAKGGRKDHGKQRASDHAGSGGDVSDGPAVDVICGGFPCQDYSVAGQRGGLVGDRGALWWEMHRIIAEQRPTWVVGENVPGLLSSNGGADFLAIVQSLVQLGYGVTWATLDSQYFGVAQRRRRLFIVGHSGGEPRPEILAISEGLYGHPAPSREAGQGATGGPTYSVDRNINPHGPHGPHGTLQAVGKAYGDVVSVTGEISHTLRAEGHDASEDGTGRGTPIVLADTLRSHPRPGSNSLGAIAFTSESVHQDGTHQDGTHHPLRAKGHAAVMFSDPRRHDERHRGDIRAKPCLTATNNDLLLASAHPRRLTPLECERIQGFPDGWTEFYANGERVADGPRYRMLGNAVTVNVAEWIGHRIMQAYRDGLSG